MQKLRNSNGRKRKLNVKGLFFLTAFLFCECYTFPREKPSVIPPNQRILLGYINQDGQVFSSKIGVKTKYKEAEEKLNQFEEKVHKPLLERFDKRIDEIKKHGLELEKNSTSIKRQLVAAVLIALIVPIPGAVETVLTVGLITIAYRKIREKKEDQIAKAAVEELIQNCETARENLSLFRKNKLLEFVSNWRREFRKEENHVVSHADAKDIRIYDLVNEKFQKDAEWLKSQAETELAHANLYCSQEINFAKAEVKK
ncbi:hypothetical protein [Leptospira tipperaryensis]|uniref:hypothetical protein n=1 Tax=Leptospira tipperaryensis TaxID=2564040 RepID=UPI000A822084|nr:hypothetical protein [Leptospira tipperaryensis]